MCCVVGYVGRNGSREVILEGLMRLEYRGYDSAGFGTYDVQAGCIATVKVVGEVQGLVNKLALQEFDGPVGIGHTRWATHGAVTEENAHPVFDCTQSIAVVQNGTLENDAALRGELKASGHFFTSQTDTELIAHCFEEALAQAGGQHYLKSLSQAELYGVLRRVIGAVALRLRGTYACIVCIAYFPQMLIAMRNKLPLCLGKCEGGICAASDPLAFAGKATSMLFIPDESYALISATGWELFSFRGELLSIPTEPCKLSWDHSGKRGHKHYMLKEIYEQSEVLQLIAQYGFYDVSRICDELPDMVAEKKVYFVGCGTSAHAASMAQWFFESLLGRPSFFYSATDMRERPLFLEAGSWVFALSQSGETADLLESVRLMQVKAIKILAITNVERSTLARMCEQKLPIRAGVEVAVASTKSLVAHVAVLYLLAYEMAICSGKFPAERRTYATEQLQAIAEILTTVLSDNEVFMRTVMAPYIAQFQQMFVLGRADSYPVAREVALKCKELAYIFAEAYSSGELKHGPLALIDGKTLTLVCSVLDGVAYHKLVINVQQIRSRRGKIVALIFEGQDELRELVDQVIVIPRPQDLLLGPLLMVAVSQFLVYAVADFLQLPIDKPRNLAKSVTVE